MPGVRAGLFAACVFVAGGVTANAAPIFIQDYEAPGNLDAPFNLVPDFSGTTVGVSATTDTIVHVADDGADSTIGSAEMFMEHNTAESPTAGGWQWQVRFLPNSGGSNNATNPLFSADGYVGYWLKVDPTVTANMQTAPVLEDSTGTGTATAGVLRTIIRDGQWHLYQWNLDDPAEWPSTFNGVFGGGALGNTTMEASVSFDSIAIVSDNGGNATVRIDQIGYDNAGALPEPTSLVSLGAIGALGLLRRRR